MRVFERESLTAHTTIIMIKTVSIIFFHSTVREKNAIAIMPTNSYSRHADQLTGCESQLKERVQYFRLHFLYNIRFRVIWRISRAIMPASIRVDGRVNSRCFMDFIGKSLHFETESASIETR